MTMVYMGGHVSGAHYNPAVTFGVFLRRKIGAVEMLAYRAAQLVGAVLAFVLGYLIRGHSPGIHPGQKVDVFQALAVEILFTGSLLLVVLNVAMTKATQGNSFYGLAIGFTIAAAIFVGGPIFGALTTRRSASAPLSARRCSPGAAGRTCGSTLQAR